MRDDNKKETNESDAVFLKRIKGLMDSTSKNFQPKDPINTPAIEKMREEGKNVGIILKEIEECDKISEEFKKKPPLLTTKHIYGITVERFYGDPEEARKVDLLKKHTVPFHSATKDTSIFPIVFETFGNAYIIRNNKKVILPSNLYELPFIIKDGDIIGTEDKSFVLELKNESQNEENNYWHIFIFPNSELKISISEKTTNPEPAFMSKSQVSDEVINNSSNTVTTSFIKDIELIRGLFHLNIKRKGRNINEMVKFSSGYPQVEFVGGNGLINDIVAMIELNKDMSIVLFSISSQVLNKATGKKTKIISGDVLNPVKITLVGGNVFETDCDKNPDPRVHGIMKMWMAISSYIETLSMIEDNSAKQLGNSLSVEKAQKMVEYAKTLGDKDMENASLSILKQNEKEFAQEKSLTERASDTKGQKKEAEEMLKFAEESKDKDMIEVAKAQVANMSGSSLNVGFEGSNGNAIIAQVQNNFESLRLDVEVDLPSYNQPIPSDLI